MPLKTPVESNRKEPDAVPPSSKVTPVRVQRSGSAVALDELSAAAQTAARTARRIMIPEFSILPSQFLHKVYTEPSISGHRRPWKVPQLAFLRVIFVFFYLSMEKCHMPFCLRAAI